MKIAIMADSHDNVPMITAALEVFRQRKAECLLHAGDIVAPFSAKELVKWERPLHAIFGNNDGERAGLARLVPGICDGPRVLALAGKCVLLVHARENAPVDLVALADAVVFGHTHEALIERGQPLFINPGETGGWLTGRSTAALWDTATGEVEIIELP